MQPQMFLNGLEFENLTLLFLELIVFLNVLENVISALLCISLKFWLGPPIPYYFQLPTIL